MAVYARKNIVAFFPFNIFTLSSRDLTKSAIDPYNVIVLVNNPHPVGGRVENLLKFDIGIKDLFGTNGNLSFEALLNFKEPFNELIEKKLDKKIRDYNYEERC